MKIYIDRSHCDVCQEYCDRHVAKLIRFPTGTDRPCIDTLEDDGQEALTIVVRDGENEIALILHGQDHEIAEVEGLSSFLPWLKSRAKVPGSS
jgi:hypothetical protein